MIKSYPKVFQLGDRYSAHIFDGIVEVSEKIDGSQFSFGKLDGNVFLRSKGSQIFPETTDKLFKPAVSTVLSIADKLPDGISFYGETLCRPKHNTLEYARVPKGNVALFAGLRSDDSCLTREELEQYAEEFGVDCVPVLYTGPLDGHTPLEFVQSFLGVESYLGGPKAEGVVIKNWAKPAFVGDVIMPFTQAKFVTETFKEVHTGWNRERTGKGKWEVFKEGFRTDARWNKAIQHLRDAGQLEMSPRDIGKLLAEIKNDVATDEKESIKEFLWKEFGEEVLRVAIAGFPEYYKEWLVKENTSVAA